MNKEQKARELFLSSYNCAQSTFSVFADELHVDKQKALAISAGFGAGVCYQGRSCGAVIGAYMALGLHSGNLYNNPEMLKENTYQLIKEFNRQFESIHGITICKELIGFDLSTTQGIELGKSSGVFKTKCPKLVETAVSIVDVLIREQD
ncbi:MAG: C_GCAxxG_C_C family protein [Salinivirgaceae bacterium]|nr:C_GCAxxG_C_C family protein [Salinivirgaceae bacterium]